MQLCVCLIGLSVAWGWNLGLPRKVLYIDSNYDYSNPDSTIVSACQAGYNVVNLAFYLSTGPFDLALSWSQLSQTKQQAAIATCHANNAAVMVSYGGSTEHPYTDDPSALGHTLSQFVLSNNLDGVDFDLENFNNGMTYSTLIGAKVVAWLINVTTATRTGFGGASNKFISHAPQSPYFGQIGNSSSWAGATGGYSGVYVGASSSIDWFNVQFYNQGASCYTTETGLFTSSVSDCREFPGTSVSEIASYGIPASKIVVGKYDPTNAATNGYVSPSNLASWLPQTPNGGLMLWQWTSLQQVTVFVQAVYAGGTSAPTVSPRPTGAPHSTAPSNSPAPSSSAAPSSSPAPTSQAASVGVSFCSDVGQASLCSQACAGTCRGFLPYYNPGCLAATSCSNPPPNSAASACDCASKAPSTVTSNSLAPSSPAPTNAGANGSSSAPSPKGRVNLTDANPTELNAAGMSSMCSLFFCLSIAVLIV